MPTQEKEDTIGGISESIRSSEAVLFTDYRGLTVAQVGDLRKKLKSSDTSFAVVKNTLFKRASEGLIDPDPNVDATLNGPTAAIYAHSDPVATSKAVLEYIATNRNTPLKVKGAVVNGKFYTAEQVTELSKVPPRDVLIAMMLGSLNAPIAGFVGTLGGILNNFVFTLQAVRDLKESDPRFVYSRLDDSHDPRIEFGSEAGHDLTSQMDMNVSAPFQNVSLDISRQIEATRSQLELVRSTLSRLQATPDAERTQNARLREAEEDGLASLIDDLKEDLRSLTLTRDAAREGAV